MFNNLDSIVSYIASVQLDKHSSAKKRFDIISTAFSLLELDIDPKRVVIVAGTNGKGSTSSSLCKLLLSSGKKVGLYTSPHLVDIRERIKFNFIDIPENSFICAFNVLYKTCYLDNKLILSQFEYLTLIACYYFFVEKKVNYAIFEVGMGGVYDATNVVPHNTCVITSVDIDHECFLGSDIISIFNNKIGIINDPQEQTVIFTRKLNKKCYEILKSLKCKKLIKSYNYETKIYHEDQTPRFSISINDTEFQLNLQGERACENSSLALTAFEQLGFNIYQYQSALSDLIWIGRMSKIIFNNREIFLSGDHNPAGIKSLCEILTHYKYNKIHIIIGFSVDKDFNSMLTTITSIKSSIIYITESSFKPRKIEEYGERWLSLVHYHFKNPITTLQNVIESASEEDMILVTGSLYLVGDILKYDRISKNT